MGRKGDLSQRSVAQHLRGFADSGQCVEHPFAQLRAAFVQAHVDTRLGQDFKGRERGSARYRIATAGRGRPRVPRAGQSILRDHVHKVGAAGKRAERKTSAQGLAVGDEIGPDAVITAADTDDVQIATLAYGLGNWHLIKGDKVQARAAFERSVQASGGWPGFGFILSEVELKRLSPPPGQR